MVQLRPVVAPNYVQGCRSESSIQVEFSGIEYVQNFFSVGAVQGDLRESQEQLVGDSVISPVSPTDTAASPSSGVALVSMQGEYAFSRVV